MNRIYDKCCGIDVHKKLFVACLLSGSEGTVREFGTTTSEILELADWLLQNNCEMVAMESTASYWKPLYNILESVDLKAIVVNAQHMKAVPGRKTDVKDAEWIADLLAHGLLQPSFIPDRDQRELRELVSYRKSLTQDKNRELNRLQKMLEGANIKLSNVIADISSHSARYLLKEIMNGVVVTRGHVDRLKTEGLIHHRIKASSVEIAEACRGHLSPIQKKMLAELLRHIDELDEHIRNLDDDIDHHMKDDEHKAVSAIKEVTGLGENSAKIIVSVIGTDMERFPTDSQIASWAGLCPGNNESAKKRRTGRTTKGNKLLRSTLIVCAHSAAKVKSSYFHAQFKRISARRGSKRAYVAVAHSMLIAVYHILRDGIAFRDLGAEYYNQFNRDKKIASYLKKLKALGWEGPEATTVLPA